MCWPHSTCRFCTFKEKFLISFWCAVCNGIFYTEKFLEKKSGLDIYWQIVGEWNGVGCHNLAWNVLAIQYFGDPMSSHTVRPGKWVAREGEKEGGVTVGGA